MRNVELKYDNDITYTPTKIEIQDAVIDILKYKFNVKDDGGITAVMKIACQDEDLMIVLMCYYMEEIKEKFKERAKEANNE